MSNSETRFREFSPVRTETKYGWRHEGIRHDFSVKSNEQTIDTLSAYFRFVVEVDGKEIDHSWVLPKEICCRLSDLEEKHRPKIHGISNEMIEAARADLMNVRQEILSQSANVYTLRQIEAEHDFPRLIANG